MKKLTTLRGIRDPYSRRILSKVLRKDVLQVLARTPGRVKILTRGLSGTELTRRPAPGKWSVAEIVCHLCDAELVLAFRIRMALAQSGNRLQAIDERRWGSILRYRTADVNAKRLLFSELRKDLVRTLRGLSGKEWERYGKHEERGKETVGRMAQLYAGHDLNHLAQIRLICGTMSKKK